MHDKRPIVAIDPALFMSAESLLGKSETPDPFALDSLEIIATHYCNNASLIVPLPGKDIGLAPAFLGWWDKSNYSFLAELEFVEDVLAEDLLKEHGANIISFLEHTATPVAKFVAHQFSEKMVDQHISRGIGLADVVRVSMFTNFTVDEGRAPKLVTQLEKLRDDGTLRQPARYRDFIGSMDIPTFLHLCCGYAIASCLRGKKFSLGISSENAALTYEHHWLRAAVLREKSSEEEIREKTRASYPKWGALVVNAIRHRVISLDFNEVADFVQNLRSNLPQDILGLSEIDRMDALVDLIVRLKIAPPYKNSGYKELTEKLIKNADEGGFFASTILEVIRSLIPIRWIMHKESQVRSQHLRSTYWNKYDADFFRRVFPSD